DEQDREQGAPARARQVPPGQREDVREHDDPGRAYRRAGQQDQPVPAPDLGQPPGRGAPRGTHGRSRGTHSRTRVPAPGVDSMSTRPPTASIRPRIEARCPIRPAVESGSYPRPSSTISTTSPPSAARTVTVAAPVPACFATLVSASRTAATSAPIATG